MFTASTTIVTINQDLIDHYPSTTKTSTTTTIIATSSLIITKNPPSTINIVATITTMTIVISLMTLIRKLMVLIPPFEGRVEVNNDKDDVPFVLLDDENAMSAEVPCDQGEGGEVGEGDENLGQGDSVEGDEKLGHGNLHEVAFDNEAQEGDVEVDVKVIDEGEDEDDLANEQSESEGDDTDGNMDIGNDDNAMGVRFGDSEEETNDADEIEINESNIDKGMDKGLFDEGYEYEELDSDSESEEGD
ncbi:hypothetical protein RIF29_39325 [Crotalaria pallida]|uniref:Uncharacterized protein n=1 Tax=Crotalaria pallida TaxID=3830 RepID=A0AAN9HQL0_CROPI